MCIYINPNKKGREKENQNNRESVKKKDNQKYTLLISRHNQREEKEMERKENKDRSNRSNFPKKER